MLTYIIKSTLCLFIAVAFYKLFLERTNLHWFKRIYLILAIISAVCIPLITITTYIEPVTLEPALVSNPEEALLLQTDATLLGTAEKYNYWSILLWSIYGLGVIVFGVRFVRNLINIYNRITHNQQYRQHNFIHVLLKEIVVPHTFFTYVFVNKTKFEENAIPKEVLLHEQAHAREKHSLDVLLVELFQVVFWFNPFIQLLKKDMKLNHEFMADAAVIHHGADQKDYQNLLLQYSSNHETCALAHAFNYSSIKKRFTVMKTKTSTRSKWIKSFLIIPLLAFMIYGFSSEKEVIRPSDNATLDHTDYTARSLTINVLEEGSYLIENVKANPNTLVDVVHLFHQDISTEIRNKIMNIHVKSASKLSESETWFLFEALKDYGFHRMVTPNEEIIKSKGNTPQRSTNYAKAFLDGAKRNGKKAFVLEIYNSQIRFNNQAVQLSDLRQTIDDYTQNWEETDYTSAYPSILHKNTPMEFLEKVEYEFIQTHYSKANEGMKILSPNAAVKTSKKQKSASRDQMKQYNKLASYYNKMIAKGQNINIKMKDVEMLKYIYDLMSEKQRADAEPFPDFPEPPPAPDTPEPPKPPKNKAAPKSLKVKASSEPMAVKELSVKEKERRNVAVKKALKELPDESIEVKAPKPPKPPKNPLDHVITMAKKGAVFYYEGKQIPSDKAIALLKKDKSLNIQATNENKGSPIVKISKNPIKVKPNYN